jgi:hypothetical protein
MPMGHGFIWISKIDKCFIGTNRFCFNSEEFGKERSDFTSIFEHKLGGYKKAEERNKGGVRLVDQPIASDLVHDQRVVEEFFAPIEDLNYHLAG